MRTCLFYYTCLPHQHFSIMQHSNAHRDIEMKTYLNMDEVGKLENTATCLRDKLLIRLLRRLGCRISEALALEVKDIDFTESTITIQHLKSRVKLTCPQCRARLGKGHSFCPRCGVRVEKAVAKEHILSLA